MYYIKKRIEVAMAHKLELSYESKCCRLHGHNAIVVVYCKSKELNKDGMVIDFTHVKKVVHDALDHTFVNDVVDFNPTAENLSKWICDQIPGCYKVSFTESENNEAVYVRDEDLQDSFF